MGIGSNFLNFLNFRGNRNGRMFTDVGGRRPDPVAAGYPLLADRDAFELTRGIEQVAGDAGFAGLAQDISGRAVTIDERGAQPLSSLGEEGARGDAGGGLAKQLVGRPLTLAVPDDASDMAIGRGHQSECQGGRWATKVVFGRGQNTALGIVGIQGKKEPTASGADDADAAAAAIEGIGAWRLVEVADGYDGSSGALGETFEGMEGAAHPLIGIGVVTTR